MGGNASGGASGQEYMAKAERQKDNSLNAGIHLKYPVPNCRLLIRAKKQLGILP